MSARSSSAWLRGLGLAVVLAAAIFAIRQFTGPAGDPPEAPARQGTRNPQAHSPAAAAPGTENPPAPVPPADEPVVQRPTPPPEAGAEDWIEHFDKCGSDPERVNVIMEKQAEGPEWLLKLAKHALKRGSPRVRDAATRASLSLPGREAVELLELGLEDSDPDVRTGSLQYGRELETEARIAVFEAGLHSGEPDLRQASLAELSRETHPNAITVLSREMVANDAGLRDQAWEVLKPILEPLSNRSFPTPDAAAEWWQANSENFDSALQWVGEMP